MMRTAFATTFASVLALQSAWTGEVIDNAAKAEQAAARGDGAAAIAAFEAAQEALWQSIPLVVRNVTHVTSATGVGVYAPRANHVYKPGEEISVYVEPFGYAYGKDQLGNNALNLRLDVTFKSLEGKIAFEDKDMEMSMASTRGRNRELYLKLNIKPGQTPPGKYVLEMKIHDQNSNKSAGFSTDAEIAP